MKPVTIVLAAMALIALPLAGFGIWSLLPERAPETYLASGPGIDSGARIALEEMRVRLDAQEETIAALREEIGLLREGMNSMSGRIALAGASSTVSDSPLSDELFDETLPRDGPNTIIDRYAQVVLVADRRNVSEELRVGTPTFLEGFLGRPREVLSDNCEPMTNPKLRALLKTEQVGPIRVTMLQPALDSLKRVFAKVEATDPDLYARINTAGALCVRQIRGTRGRTSTHSFGLAVDLNIDGKLDTLGDGRTQLGLTILADFFLEEGWVWGAAFSREDSMHFEVSKQQLLKWREEGKI